MILSDKDIKKYLEEKKILVDPLNLEEQLGPSSLDLRLGNSFRVFKVGMLPYIDPRTFEDNLIINYKKNGITVEEHEYTIVYNNMDSFIIHPNEFVLATTLEYIKLPEDIVARLEGRSSLGRLGIIVHATAGYIDPGFEGNITLEISNVGNVPVKLYAGMRICQLVFQTMSSFPEKPYNKREQSKYYKQRGPTGSRIKKDFKNEVKVERK